ncbi:MAG TPA: orotidine-5'-phosphate decarboxylase [Clostridia bacterium]|jgi:orotidine-5'-phosphate decarboxylase|nr:orotidine-5'-phosphate decarboxylase [Clostridia bacterium]
MKNFADKLIEEIKNKESYVVCGLDPIWESIPEGVKVRFKSKGAAIFAFNKAIIDAIHDVVVCVKPQLAYYEQYGINGLIAFKATVEYARKKGLLVIADGKRNDIGSTSLAYAKAYLSKGDASDLAFDCDALTVNPYLGWNGIQPFVEMCKQNSKGIFILVKTSNPSSGELQDLIVEGGRTIYEKVAELVDKWGSELVGDSGYSSVGAVVGATYPEQAERIRKIIPRSIILVPGYGAQGGNAKSVVVNFNDDGLGAVVNASRSILYAYKSDRWSGAYDEDAYADAARAEAVYMRDEINMELEKRQK